MEKVELYVAEMFETLLEKNFFTEDNPFLDTKIFGKIIKEIATENYMETGDPALSDIQLLDAIEKTTKTALQETLDDMLVQGKIEISGINEHGEFLYSKKKN